MGGRSRFVCPHPGVAACRTVRLPAPLHYLLPVSIVGTIELHAESPAPAWLPLLLALVGIAVVGTIRARDAAPLPARVQSSPGVLGLELVRELLAPFRISRDAQRCLSNLERNLQLRSKARWSEGSLETWACLLSLALLLSLAAALLRPLLSLMLGRE